MKKVLVIINRKAGTDKIKNIQDKVLAVATTFNFQFEFVFTTYQGHARKLTQEAIESNFHSIVAVGGDGTVNEIASVLVHTQVRLGIIPLGSGNGLARSLHIPINIDKALKIIISDYTIAIDSGIVNDKYSFFSNIGFGFDTEVTRLFANSHMRGIWKYTAIVGQQIWSYPQQSWNVEMDGVRKKMQGFMLNISNAPQFGYNFKIAPKASMQDGKFDLVFIKNFPKIWGLIIGMQGFLGNLNKSTYVEHYTVRNISIHNLISKFQIDGDFYEITPQTINIKILNQSLNVLVDKNDTL